MRLQFQSSAAFRIARNFWWTFLLIVVPLSLAIWALGLRHWNLAIPLVDNEGDATWQFMLTKTLTDTGWILTNKYLGAPGIAHFAINAAGQTSALHSVIMVALSNFIDNPIRLQQTYYVLNFPLICITSFIACRYLGVGRLASFVTGMLFSFTSFRFDESIYAFIANYFMIPLAIVPIVWIACGRFNRDVHQADSSKKLLGLKNLLMSRDFWLGGLFLVLMAVSDGYYSFFTLLLLGFGSFLRIVGGDWRRPFVLFPAAAYVSTTLIAALALQIPLHQYAQRHHYEFYPNGIKDPTLFKSPFEAEVYSSSLKLMLSPVPDHRLKFMRELSAAMTQSSDDARAFKYDSDARLGTLADVIFVLSLLLLVSPEAKGCVAKQLEDGFVDKDKTAVCPAALLNGLLALSFFVFLCSISGGIGTLIALVFPTIRAYDRFTLFLIFLLYLTGAVYFTAKTSKLESLQRIAWSSVLVLVMIAALFDQVPNDSRHGSEATKIQFQAEGRFVRYIEQKLPPDAMVYQYPYSQYLYNSPYYGWGSFAGVRLYLQSRGLHWSNGGAKNGYADNWDYFVSQLPPAEMIAEVEAAGFKGFVIDQTVVKPDEFQKFYAAFVAIGAKVVSDPASHLSFIDLPDPGYRIVYNRQFTEAHEIVISNPEQFEMQNGSSIFIDGAAIDEYLLSHQIKTPITFTQTGYPAFFSNKKLLAMGFGRSPIHPITAFKGTLTCEVKGSEVNPMVELKISNNTEFDWQLGSGQYPIGIGVHLADASGRVLFWDSGFRVPTKAYIKQGTSVMVAFPVGSVPVAAVGTGGIPRFAEFSMVQDGNIWFNGVSCEIPLN